MITELFGIGIREVPIRGGLLYNYTWILTGIFLCVGKTLDCVTIYQVPCDTPVCSGTNPMDYLRPLWALVGGAAQSGPLDRKAANPQPPPNRTVDVQESEPPQDTDIL